MDIILFAIWYSACLSVSAGLVAEVDVYQLQTEVLTMKTQLSKLQDTIHLLQGQLNTTSFLAAQAAANPAPPPVAFTAHLSKTIVSIPVHQHVTFDNVITNIGGHYSAATGHFTAPVFGLYSFFVTATNTPGHSTSLSLMQNGQQKAFTLAHGTSATPSQWETSTMAAVLALNPGDEVWAQNEGSFSPTEDLDGYNYSSFTGYLINKI